MINHLDSLAIVRIYVPLNQDPLFQSIHHLKYENIAYLKFLEEAVSFMITCNTKTKTIEDCEAQILWTDKIPQNVMKSPFIY